MPEANGNRLPAMATENADESGRVARIARTRHWDSDVYQGPTQPDSARAFDIPARLSIVSAWNLNLQL